VTGAAGHAGFNQQQSPFNPSISERIVSLSGGIILSQINGGQIPALLSHDRPPQRRHVDQYLVFAILRPFSHRLSNKKRERERERRRSEIIDKG